MQRNGPQGNRDRRGTAQRDATQPMAGQPRAESDDDELQEPENVPIFLTARELQARDPGKPSQEDEAGEPRDRSEKTSTKGRVKPK